MRIILSFVLVFSFISLFAQQNGYLCKYVISSQRDSNNSNSKFRDTMYLQINRDSSVYYSHLYQLGRRRSEEDNGKSLEYHMEQQIKNWYYPSTDKEILIHSFRDNKRKVIIKFKNDYVYSEDIISPTWKVLRESRMMLGNKCEKAVTYFKGRNYVAWFTRSIPYKMGSWQFTGLPGLILSIADVQDHYTFECIELVKNGNDSIFKIYTDLKESTKQKVEELKKLWLTDMITFDAIEWNSPSYSVNPDGSQRPAKSIIQPFNPIDRTFQY